MRDKKLRKLIVINILIMIFSLFLVDQVCYRVCLLSPYASSVRKYFPIISFEPYKPIIGLKKRYQKYLLNKKEIDFRKDLVNKNSDKSILVLGCSFANGTILPNDKNFSGKLHNITGKTVYNRAMPGWGFSEAIVLFQNGLNTEIHNPEYIIYVFIENHLLRLYTTCNPLFSDSTEFFRYDKNKKLVKKEGLSLIYLHSYILRCLYRKLYLKGWLASYEEQKKFLLDHIILLNNLIKKSFPKSRFVILSYTTNKYSVIFDIEKEIKENNIEVVYLSDLSDINFGSDEFIYDFHPNAKAWEIITPLIVQKLSL